MDEDAPFRLPTIEDEDIRRVSKLLGLREDAFYGKDGADPRREVLKSMETMDVAACPGSGKTTLLVAKLAILAQKWRCRTRGVCVLSHTNAARREIESRLGNTSPGRRLLSYPHFVGTIHGFVNEFLALPWLRSQGHSGVRFNSEIAGHKIWKLSGWGRQLPRYLFQKFENAETRKSAVCSTHYAGNQRDLVLEATNARLRLKRKPNSSTFQKLDGWKSKILREGYAAYEDTFAYGHAAISDDVHLADVLRDRFPLLFIDESQDNREEQSAMLFRIFVEGEHPSRRQRFGDDNQAIFNSANASGASTDPFPNPTTRTDLPNSHRFGQTIADMAAPLGLTQYPQGLQGQKPETPLASGASHGQHTVFLFSQDSANGVLEAYGKLLVRTFSEQELSQGTFAAVGQVHRDNGADHHPRHVGHYWADYDPGLLGLDPQPETFVQYVLAGMGKARLAKEAFPAVEKIAEGITRLAAMANPSIRARRQFHQDIMQRLENCPEARELYMAVLDRFAVRREPPTREMWNDRRCNLVRSIAAAVADAEVRGAEADEFLTWREGAGPASEADGGGEGNLYKYPHDDPKVLIRVGSIHSVKGETHTATLVMETFWQGQKGRHNLELLLPWLNGSRSGRQGDRVYQNTRLKLHYVAMTRPTHLLCLAMKRSTFQNPEGEMKPDEVQRLRRHGWHIKCLPLQCEQCKARRECQEEPVVST